MSKKRKSGARSFKQQRVRVQQPEQSHASKELTPGPDPAAANASAATERHDGEGSAESSFQLNAPAGDPREDARHQQAVELGQQLRQTREQMGMELDEAARHMHLPWRVIAKLEAGDWRGIDSPIYLHGYLRSYTGLLGMPTPDLVDDVGHDVAIPQPLVSTGGISRSRYLMQRYAVAGTYLVITALIVVPVIILGINGGLKHNLARLAPLDPTPLSQPLETVNSSHSSDTATARSARADQQKPLMASMAPVNLIDQGMSDIARSEVNVPEKVREPAPKAAAVESEALSIKLTAPSWVEVTSANGEQLAYALLEAGTHVYQGQGALTIRLGNAGAAEVRVDGRTLDLEAYRRSNVAYFQVDKHGSLHAPPDA